MRAWLGLVALAGASVAHADTAADAKFTEGKKLLDKKQYAEACKAFEESFAIDAEIGSELNVALCYEEWGHLATALEAYKKALSLAEAKKDKRVARIKARLEEVDGQVPRLTVQLKGDALDGVEVTLDGKPLAKDKLGQEMMVDPGSHVVVAARGADTKSKTVPLEAGGSSEVTIDAPPKRADVVVKPPPHRGSTSSSGSSRRKLYGIGVGGAGVVAMGVSGLVALHERTKYKDALADHCGGSTTGCDELGLFETHHARHFANISTAAFLGGAALATAGVVLYVTAPKKTGREMAVSVHPTGVSLRGRF